MKTIFNALAIATLVMFSSCATTAKFPVSDIVPAATISAKKGQDNQKNFTVKITAKDLASPERLSPPGNNYSIWIVTKEYGVKNIGQLNVKNANNTTFQTTTPFDFDQIFITVEDQGDQQFPEGMVICATKI